MSPQQAVGFLIEAEFRPLAALTGFREGDDFFWRRMGGVVQRIRVHRREKVEFFPDRRGGMRREEGEQVTADVGLSFDALWDGPGAPDEDRLRVLAVHFLRRLKALVPGTPDWWTVIGPYDLAATRRQFRTALEMAVAELDAIDSPGAFLRHWWSGLSPDREPIALLHYAEGNYRAALDELRRGEAYSRLVRRRGVADIIERRRMVELRPLLDRTP